MNRTEAFAMHVSVVRSSGRADPFGLLIVTVLLALSVTIAVQAQAPASGERVVDLSHSRCDFPCMTVDRRS